MKRKTASALMLASVLLFSLMLGTLLVSLTEANFIPPIQHNSGIFIRSNGSIDPSTAPIHLVGNVYTFAGDVSTGIAVEKSNVTLDGQGYPLSGNNDGTGVLLDNVNNVTIRNVRVQNFSRGVYLTNSSGNVITGNTLTGCGIVVTTYSNNNQIAENTILKSDISLSASDSNSITGNTARAISVIFSSRITVANNKVADEKRVDERLLSIGEGGGLYVANSNGCNLFGNTVERKTVGVHIWYCTNLTLSGNTLRDNQIGFRVDGPDLQHNLFNIDAKNTVGGKPIYFLVNKHDFTVPTNAGWIAAVNCTNITISNWTSSPNWNSVYFVNTKNSAITHCNLTGNFNALMLIDSSNLVIHGNLIKDNGYAAMYLDGTVNCTITENDVSNNYCIFNIRHGAANHTFFHNNFGGNWTGSFERGFLSKWDDGTEGNYWSNYTGLDLDGNGIGDTPFSIDSSTHSGETDNFPLTAPLEIAAGIQTQLQAAEEPVLSMPEEYLNYTISSVNGTLWAKIDGVYPMHLSEYGDALPMVYPTPPNTTNMHIWLDDAELSWSNFSEIEPTAMHHTDIGDWQMIYCDIAPSSPDFVLKIHYEHPVQVINGTYTFLYDLNISPYLSPSAPKSTAHFSISVQANCSGINVYTTGNNGIWSPMNYTSMKEGNAETVTFNIVSEYDKPLLGDIAVALVDAQVPEFPTGIFAAAAVAAATLVSFVVVFGARARKRP